MTTKKKRMGRPPLENPASAILPHIRVRPEELEGYRAAAGKKEMKLSAWVRSVLGRAAKRVKD